MYTCTYAHMYVPTHMYVCMYAFIGSPCSPDTFVDIYIVVIVVALWRERVTRCVCGNVAQPIFCQD
jgi:hypothetical protein